MIDSHCHLDGFERTGELDAVISRARDAGVDRMVTIGTSMADWPVYARIAVAHPGVVDWTAGLHPTELGDDWADQVATLASWFATQPRPVGIGEVGLDYFHLPKDPVKAAPMVVRQKAAFKAQLEIALQLDCPLVIHARKSFADAVAMIDASGIDWHKVVFHCFGEGVAEVRLLNDRGGRASFTGTITFKNGTTALSAAVEQGLDRLMLETDSPYLAPEPVRATRCEPACVMHTARRLALEMGLPVDELCARASRNAVSFFSLS
jgi:TatD DNase family protein